jgi:hypothetical protein
MTYVKSIFIDFLLGCFSRPPRRSVKVCICYSWTHLFWERTLKGRRRRKNGQIWGRRRRRTHERLYTIPYGSGVADGRLNVRDGEKKIQSLRSQKTGHVMLMIFRATATDAGATSVRTAASVGFGQLRVPLCHFFSHERKERRKEREKRRERERESIKVNMENPLRHSIHQLLSNKKNPPSPAGVPPFCANDPPWPSNGYIISNAYKIAAGLVFIR